MPADEIVIGHVGQKPIWQGDGLALVMRDLPVKVNADGANGQTWVAPGRARQLGLYVPAGVARVPLAAYHPADWGDRDTWLPPGRAAYGLDAPENGGRRIFAADDEVLYRAWGFLLDEHGEPVIQGPRDPAPGYYISTTALRDESLPPTDPRSYFDAAGSPAWTLPGTDLATFGVRKGDLALVRNGPYWVWAQGADEGKNGDLLELSPAACDVLGIPDRARDGGVTVGVSIIILPGSAHLLGNKPASADAIQEAGKLASALYGLPGGL